MQTMNRPGPSSQPEGFPTDVLKVDHSSTILSKIAKKFYEDKLMSDVCLVVGGKDYLAHRLILCAYSEVFHVMLMDPNWDKIWEYQNSRIPLTEPPQCCDVFGDFLAYLYTGQIQISLTTVVAFMTLADKYKVHDLMNVCKNFMLKNIPTAAKYSQLMNWLQYSFSCGHQELAVACRDYIKLNFQSVASQEDFPTWKLDVLMSLIQLDDLVIYDEETLFHCLVKWIEAQEDQNESLVRQVLNYVRFPMLSPRQLAELVFCPLTERYKDFFLERMAIGFTFHLKDDSSETFSQKSSYLFTPRLYTSENWGTQLTVENFSMVQAFHTRTLRLSSPVGCAESETDLYEWIVDFSPKGVSFKDCQLIPRPGNIEVPEAVLRTVRLSLTLKDPDEAHVRIAVLVYETHGGVEHVKSAKVRNFIFTKEEPVLRYDDLVPYADLNPDADRYPPVPSPYLTGPKRDTLKIHIIILPHPEAVP